MIFFLFMVAMFLPGGGGGGGGDYVVRVCGGYMYRVCAMGICSEHM